MGYHDLECSSAGGLMNIFHAISSLSLVHKLLLIGIAIGLGVIGWFTSRLNVEMNLGAFKWMSKKKPDDADFYIDDVKESLKQIDPVTREELKHDLVFQEMIAQYKERRSDPDEKTKYLRKIVEYMHEHTAKVPKE
jgi:hypothetical protein